MITDLRAKVASKLVRGDASHLRKGRVGDWRTHFDARLFGQFEREVRARFGPDGLGLEYDLGEGRVWKLQDGAAADEPPEGDGGDAEGEEGEEAVVSG